jgi:hypothetical protein
MAILMVSPEVGKVWLFGSYLERSPLRGSKAMARDGPKTQMEKKQKHPITATIQDFSTIDFISLPPFLNLIRICIRLKKGLLRLGNLPRNIILSGKSQFWQLAKSKT